MLFENENIRLRALEPEDLDWLYRLENDDQLWSLGCTNVPYSKFALKNYISCSCHDLYADGQLRLVIEEKKSNKVVGCVDLVDFTPRHLRAEVGIIVFKDFQNKGIATEALNLLCGYACDFLFIHQLYAIVAVTNMPAIKLFESAQFKKQSVLSEWLRDGHNEYNDAFLFSRILY